ncbi:MAG: FAD-binding protein [Proteobacteria bacterium]|nr:FAD-binding protein [Pseudomonadota bacterium]
MKADQFVNNLRRIVGDQHVSAAGTDVEVYSYDASLAKGVPSVVVFPADTSEISRVASLAYNAGVPYIPRGYGTNLSGGTVPTSGGLVICLSRFNRILAIRPDRRYAVVQTGVTNLELQNALAPLGFFYAPDPASQKVATLGGNVAENSGGPRCLKYGVTTNHILGMQVVLPDGEVVQLGGAALDPPGYDLRGVVTGSEGTFGTVTEVTVRILPKSENIITMLVVYDDIAAAARSVSAVISAGIVPTTLEMMDATIIEAVEDSYACGYPRDAAAVLISEVEGLPVGLKEQAESIRSICLENGCREIREAKDDEERNRLWEGRRGAFGAIARLASGYLVNDCTVPRTRLPEALAGVAAISDQYGFRHGNVFHAGDGNLHPLLFFDSRDPDQLKRVKKAGWEIMQACVKLGGTISGEHGIGLEKLEAMHLICSEDDLEFQRRLKAAFDPKNLLNPGKVLPGKRKSKDPMGPSVDQKVATALPLNNREKEIIEKIKDTFSESQSVLPVGLGSHLDFGNVGEASMLNIASTGLDEIKEFDPLNQVVIAGAGVTLDDLQKELFTQGQWLPIRPTFAHRGFTLGGLVALGVCGPERVFYGAPRDRLLGLRFIDHQGRMVANGGNVVKNVAGYEITRLMTGSAGTLGFITEVSLRTSQLPERCGAVIANGTLETCAEVAVAFNKSTLLPVFTVSVPNGRGAFTAENRNWSLVVGFEGFSQTVDYQLEKASELLEEGSLKSIDAVDYAPIAGLFQKDFTDFDRLSYVLRADFPLNRLLNFVEAISKELKIANMFIDFGCGRILAGFNTMDSEIWQRIGDLSIEYQGHAVLEKTPGDFREKHDVFGPPRPEWKTVHRIKAGLDPNNRFAPGRLPGKR